MDHIYPDFDRIVSRKEKELRFHQKSKVIWFTGLSGSGKTTLATALERDLFNKGFSTQILDGDNIRTGINNNLGFSPEDRIENIRRIAEIAKLLVNSGIICICAFVSPTEDTRKIVRDIVGKEDFLEIFVSTPIEVCETRDVKGLYQKARAGEIKEFTGISAPFEVPQHAILSIDTSNKSVEECIEILMNRLAPEMAYPDGLIPKAEN
ncbi:MAG TPA: adenylyl-sulfate kinase [Prolixibacteraceae bacterium]|nr:adenylyl-sulfate kinase [Prolixibacteraceae bacterium]